MTGPWESKSIKVYGFRFIEQKSRKIELNLLAYLELYPNKSNHFPQSKLHLQEARRLDTQPPGSPRAGEIILDGSEVLNGGLVDILVLT